jgi:serine/threonine protein kinase
MLHDPQAAAPGPAGGAGVPQGSLPTASDTTPPPAGGRGSSFGFTLGMRPLPEYELVALLGLGGCGEVWRARGPGGFEVALKFIRREGEAFAAELRSLELMKRVRHAHLLPVFGAWQQDGFLVVAMELADRSLWQRWREAADAGLPGIPAGELLEYLREAAKGIDFLNECRHPSPDGRRVSIQHRDVKPHNLLLVGGTVKLADFGLARPLEESSAATSGSATPAYAAPEFLTGQATPWSDQYSLAVSYCLLRGGRLPFLGNAVQVVAGHLMYPPDLSMLLEAERPAVARALSKKPGERWPSCRAFVEALAEVLAGPAAATAPEGGPPAHPRRKVRTGRLRWLVAGVLLCALAGGLAKHASKVASHTQARGPEAGDAHAPAPAEHQVVRREESPVRPEPRPAPLARPPAPKVEKRPERVAVIEPAETRPPHRTDNREPASDSAAALARRAREHERKGDWEGAIADYTEALRLDPGSALVHYHRACAFGEKGAWDRAAADCTEALRLDPRLAIAYLGRGVARERTGDLDGALADYREALRLEPQSAAARESLTRAYTRLFERRGASR